MKSKPKRAQRGDRTGLGEETGRKEFDKGAPLKKNELG